MAPPKPPRIPGRRLTTGEDAAVDRIREQLGAKFDGPPPGEIWIGDDAAVVRAPLGLLIEAIDTVVGGVHADLDLVGLDDLGWKALTASVSDLAAMGADPHHALVSVCAPANIDLELLTEGLAEASAKWLCPVIGGDLTSGKELVVSVSVTGGIELGAACARSGARTGDEIYVTGPLGGSAAGLRLLRAATEGDDVGDDPLVLAHRRPQARPMEGRLARLGGATAMMDISDGLGMDLDRLAQASGVGVDLDDVPVADGATLEEALGGGEDYELIIVTGDANVTFAEYAKHSLRPPCRIGRCTDDTMQRSFRGETLQRSGFEHPF